MRARRLAAVALLLAACSSGQRPAGPMRAVRDWRGLEVRVPVRPRRIVSIVPSATELLFAVGAGPAVVGVTTYCTYPPEASRRTRVGDLHINLEVLRALRPDLVVSGCTIARRSSEAIERLGIPVFCVDPVDLPDVARALRAVGDLTGHAARGEREARRLEERVAAVERAVAGRPRPTVVLELTNEPRVAAPGTYAHDVIVRAGGRNVFDDLAGPLYPAVSWEAVLARDPDVYVVTHEYGDPSGRPGFDKLRAVRSGRFYRLPKEWFMYPTPRLVRGLELLAERLHR